MKMCTLFWEEVRNYNTKAIIKSLTIESSSHPRLKINTTRRIKKQAAVCVSILLFGQR